MTKLSRRDFLIDGARIADAGVFNGWLEPLPVSAIAQQELPSVCVAEGTSEDSAAQILQTALEGLGGIGRFVKPGQTVAIKANATWAYPPKTASSTDPDFLTAVIQTVQDAGAGRIIVMDHCSIEPGAMTALRISGIGKVVRDMGVESVFPDRYDAPRSTYTRIDLPYGRANKTIGVIKSAVNADVRINLAVAKTHNVTKSSMCLKHMMGFLQQPGLLHANLEQGIADLSTPSSMQAQLHLLEAIRVRIPYGNYRVCAGPETDITHPQIVARRNTVIAGIDPVLIDAYGCINFFDIQPQELTHVLRAYESGCGDMDVKSALVDGRVRHFKVGALPDDTAATADESVGAATQSLEPKPTVVYVPASAPVGQSVASSGETSSLPAGHVINMGSLLNTALVPAAAIVTGVSLMILNRMRRRLPRGHQEMRNEQTGQGKSIPDEGDE